ncbi:MAG TPA: cyclic nucleotide-binding domain-containing protein [Gaiellaceae bacterium]|nr:cyclic nucleotide-binding domain-containing protein [Gaiellaceae bacterium]
MVRPRQLVWALGVAIRNENVRRVELAWGAAIAAEWAHFVALGVFAYQEGGTAAVGIAGLVRLLPAAVVAPFAASLGDRFRRERFLLTLTLLGAGALAASAAAALANDRVLVFAFASVVGLASTLIRPALQALLPSLARTPEELIASNGATSTIESIGTLVGPVFAGVFVSLADVAAVFVLGAAALLAGAVLLARVSVESRVGLTGEIDRESLRRMITDGFRTVVRARSARLVVGLIVAQTFVRGCLNVLIVVAAFQVFDGGAAQVGYLTAAIGAGGLIGALGAMTLGGRRLAAPFGLSLVFWGAPITLMAPRPYFAAAVVLLAIVGAANSVEDVTVFTLLQRLVPNEMLTRVLGLVWGLAMGGVAIGSIAAPAIVRAVGPRPAFVFVGSILPLLALLTYRQLVEIDRTVAPAPELELIDHVPMFSPLSIATKEQVAASLLPISVPAGEVVIRAGEAGDRFYIVADGELDIDANGRHTTAYEADYFGEIALLRDVPRTATVKAAVDSKLYVLRRADFLSAVTGHSTARAAGEAIAETRLKRSRAPGG